MRNALFTVLALLILATPAYAQETLSHVRKTDEVSAYIFAASNDNGKAIAGFHLKFKDSWKTYWRNPGDGGMPFTVNFKKSSNVKDVQIQWPAPKRFITFETIETYGYKKEVIFPLQITAIDPSKPISAVFNVDYAVCDELCVFFTDEFKFQIPVDFKDPSRLKLIENHADTIINVTLEKAQITAPQKLEVKISSLKHEFTDPDLFIEAGDDFRFPKGEVYISRDKKTAIFHINYLTMLDNLDLNNQPVTLTLVDYGDVRSMAVIKAKIGDIPPVDSKKKLKN